MDKPSSALGALSGDAVLPSEAGVSGLLWVHLLAGRGLRSTASSSAATTPSTPSGPPIGKKFTVNVKGFITKNHYNADCWHIVFDSFEGLCSASSKITGTAVICFITCHVRFPW
jgi:hypothetical protein